MTTIAMIAVIASALFHSGYNMLIKASDEKTLFMWSIFSVAVTAGWVSGGFIVPGFFTFEPTVFLFAALSAAFFTAYHLATARSYSSDEGDLSLSYPMTTLAPLFIPLWAYLYLGDRLTIMVLAGIIISTAGTFCIQLKPSLGRAGFKSVGLGSGAVRFALLASFLYSFGGISDKVGVSYRGFYLFTVYLVTMIFTYFTCLVLYKNDLRTRAFHCYRHYPLRVLLGGMFLFISNMSYRYALQTTDVSYAAGVRQVATFFAVLMGVFLLKEPYGLIRFLASFLIVMGIVLIKIG